MFFGTQCICGLAGMCVHVRRACNISTHILLITERQDKTKVKMDAGASTSMFIYLFFFAKTMLCIIDKVTTEYQHPWIAGNCRVYKYVLYADRYIGLNNEHKVR